MRTYAFKVVVEEDDGGFHAYCPALRIYGAVTQGTTHRGALRNINEVVEMIATELIEDGLPLPLGTSEVAQFDETRVAVTV